MSRRNSHHKIEKEECKQNNEKSQEFKKTRKYFIKNIASMDDWINLIRLKKDTKIY